MNDMFSRTEQLLGHFSMEKLKNSRVAIFGIGGVGGYVLEALVRSGVGAIDIIDSDRIEYTNLNRQIIALQKNIGEYKVDAAKQRALSINPDIKIETYSIFYNKENSNEINLKNYDYIVDAIDTVSSKIELILSAKESNIPIVSCMGTGNKIHPEMLEISDIYKTSVCPLARAMRYELKKVGVKKLRVVYSKELPIKPCGNNKSVPASTSFVPAAAGMILASVVVNDLIKD